MEVRVTVCDTLYSRLTWYQRLQVVLVSTAKAGDVNFQLSLASFDPMVCVCVRSFGYVCCSASHFPSSCSAIRIVRLRRYRMLR